MEKKLPEFKPLPELGNVASNYMSAFNVGMNIYEALAYLQGYVQIAYTSLDDLIDDWNNFETYVTENINQIANEKTQEILNQWLEDGTLNELIATNPQWALKVNKAGDVMSGDLQFQENTGVYGTLHSGTKVNMISHSYTGTDDYTQVGDSNAQLVMRSKNRPVWYDGSQNQDLLVEEDLTDLSGKVDTIQSKIEEGAYFTTNVGGHPTITNYEGESNVSILQPSDVVNNLSSSATDQPLSANQGKILNTSITSINGNITNINNKISSLTNHTVNEIQSVNYRCLGQTFVRKTIQFASQSNQSIIDIKDIFPNFHDNSTHNPLVFIGSDGFARWKNSSGWYGTLPLNYSNGSSNYTYIQFGPNGGKTGYEIVIYRAEASRHDITFDVYCSTSNLS